MLVQLSVIGVGNEQVIVIKEVDLLLVAHANIWMFVQEIMQRRGAGFLRTGENEIEPLDFATLGPKHRGNVHAESRRGSCQLSYNCYYRTLQLSAFPLFFIIRACTNGFAGNFTV